MDIHHAILCENNPFVQPRHISFPELFSLLHPVFPFDLVFLSFWHTQKGFLVHFAINNIKTILLVKLGRDCTSAKYCSVSKSEFKRRITPTSSTHTHTEYCWHCSEPQNVCNFFISLKAGEICQRQVFIRIFLVQSGTLLRRKEESKQQTTADIRTLCTYCWLTGLKQNTNYKESRQQSMTKACITNFN